ncbi:Hypothetical protein CINCED_3A019127 [Cinara cedri]|uniref:Uncharacterized protein n=1 Tax=Cinara cedri TaxID=506608 RepID=A0A5E4MKX1_9HEMI|nr:Hypothetical protein CINCED_3A019127 [Cinara cedri]
MLQTHIRNAGDELMNNKTRAHIGLVGGSTSRHKMTLIRHVGNGVRECSVGITITLNHVVRMYIDKRLYYVYTVPLWGSNSEHGPPTVDISHQIIDRRPVV